MPWTRTSCVEWSEPINRLPAVTLGYQLGLFPAQSGPSQSSVARQALVMNLSWRLPTYLEIEGTLSTARQRADSTSNLASTRAASIAIIWICPEAIGTKHYDQFYLDNLFQRGLAIGPVLSYQECLEDGASRAACPGKTLRETFYGAALDVRVSDKLAPRFTVGRRSFRNYKVDPITKEGSVEAGVQVVYSIK